MIIRYTLWSSDLDRLVGFQFQRRKGAAQLVGHGVWRGATVDPPQQALVVVELDQRLGLLVVLLEPVADHVGPVVVADDQLAAVDVANVLPLRRGEWSW